MKTKNILLPSIVLISILVFGIQSLKAQNTAAGPVQSTTVRIRGDDLRSEDAVLKSDGIFTANVVKVGDPAPASPGAALIGLTVNVLQNLRGQASGQIIVPLTVAHLLTSPQGLPQIGSSYIFFVNKRGSHFTAVKVLPATDDNITRVNALIAAAPASR